MSSDSSSSSSSSSGSSGSSSDSDHKDASDKLNGSMREMSQADDLVSVTVRKTSPTQKAGVSLVERQSRIFITNVTENGLFHGTEIEVGDIVLAINGQRLKKGEGAKEIIQNISKAKTTVTMVVKKANRKARRGVRSLSPSAQMRKKYGTKIHKKAFNRNEDGSLKYDIDPRLENIKKIDPNDDKPQIPISATKLFANQDIGVKFKDINNMIFVSAIAVDSIFKDTGLELGDRIVGVAGMNFMSYGDSKYAMQVVAKAAKEVALVVEKEHTIFSKKRDIDPAHDTAWVGASQHEKKTIVQSPRKSLTNGAGADEEDLLKFLDRSGHFGAGPGSPKGSKPSDGKQVRKAKAGSSKRNSSVKGKPPAKQSSTASTNKENPVKPARPENNDDSDEISIGDFAENEHREKIAARGSASKSPNVNSLSKLNQSANLGKSVNFDFDNFEGDYLKVTIRKESETQPGISLEKTEGKFILTAVPQNEKRIYPGMQVLAINGVVNIHTTTKAEDLINRSKGTVQLIIDFSSPINANGKCPCCSHQVAPEVKQVNSSIRRVVRRKIEEPNTGGGAEAISVAASENTTRVNNRAPPGKKTPKLYERPAKYQLDEFDSDSDDEGHRKGPPSPARRSSTSRYQANDKFMIRVSKTGKSDNPIGIGLFDHKGAIFVSRIDEGGLFYSTPIALGDKVLSVNGRKISSLKGASNAMSIIADKDSISIFVLRPDPNDKVVKEAIALFP